MEGKMVVGVIVRDSNDSLIQALLRSLPHYPVQYAELIATWMGVYTTVHVMKATKIYIEGIPYQ